VSQQVLGRETPPLRILAPVTRGDSNDWKTDAVLNEVIVMDAFHAGVSIRV
jgi:hypothetical protein